MSEGKRGRPREYEQKVQGRRGAPSVTVRFSPDIHERVMSQPDGARVYLEALVREDWKREQEASGGGDGGGVAEVPGEVKVIDAPEPAHRW